MEFPRLAVAERTSDTNLQRLSILQQALGWTFFFLARYTSPAPLLCGRTLDRRGSTAPCGEGWRIRHHSPQLLLIVWLEIHAFFRTSSSSNFVDRFRNENTVVNDMIY